MEDKRRSIEDLPDFDEWIANYKPPEIKYVAAFDADTGVVLCVGPDYAVDTKTYKNIIEIDELNALAILNGEVQMSKCFIDASQGKLEIVEVKNLFKIDDVLHRIIDIKWAEIDKPDVVVTYSNKKFKVEISEMYGGTYKLDTDEPFAQRKIFWDGETVLNFDITAYNDPHYVYHSTHVKLSDLVEKPFEFECVVGEDFSVFTRRLFKNYVIRYD